MSRGGLRDSDEETRRESTQSTSKSTADHLHHRETFVQMLCISLLTVGSISYDSDVKVKYSQVGSPSDEAF